MIYSSFPYVYKGNTFDNNIRQHKMIYSRHTRHQTNVQTFGNFKAKEAAGMYIEVLEVADVTISLFMVIAFHVCVQLNLLMKHLKLCM